MRTICGSYEVRLFKNQLIDFGKYGQVGLPIVVTAEFKKRFSGEVSMAVVNIQLLDDVKDSLIIGVTLNLTLDQVNSQLIDLLKEHKDSSNSDLGSLNICIFDPEINRSVSMQSGAKLPLNRKFMDILNDLNIDFTINKVAASA